MLKRIIKQSLPADPKSIILQQIARLEKTPPGFRHRDAYVRLRDFCLKNPNEVANIIFDNTTDQEIKNKLLFEYSKDHGGSCSVRDDPKWVTMVRGFIIPRLSELPPDTRHHIEWYQDVHGL